MSVLHVGGNATTTGGASATSDSWTSTSGSTIIVAVPSFNTSGVALGSDISDSKGNTYTLHNHSFGGANALGISLYSNKGGTRGTTHTVTVNLTNSSSNTSNIAVLEVSEAVTFDATTWAIATDGTTPFAVTAAAAVSGYAIFLCTLDTSGTSSFTSPPAGYSSLNVLDNGSQDLVFASYYKASETGTPTVSVANADTVTAGREMFASFTIDSGGTTGTVAQTLADFTSSASGSVMNPPGILWVKEVGAVTNTTAATTSAITVAAGGVPAGDTIVIWAAHDNSSTSPAGGIQTTSVADNSTQAGTANSYSVQTHCIADPGAANAGIEGWFAVCNVTRPLLANDTITITYSFSTTAKGIAAEQFTGVNQTTPVLSGSNAVQNDQSGQSVSVGPKTPTVNGQVVCALVAVEGGTADTFTQDTDTTDGSWVAITRRGSGTTTSGATLNGAYKYIQKPAGGYSAQTYDHATMLGTSRDHCAALLILDVQPITGTSAQTLANFTGAASGSVTSGMTGTVAVTLQDFTSAATGTETISGTSSQTLANFTSAASGWTTVTGTSAQTLANFTSAATGTETFTGTSAQTLADFTSSATGTSGSSPIGTAAVTLQDFTSAASGTETISGTVAVTLANFTSSASGTEVFTGTSAQTLANFVGAATGAETISGTSAQTLANFTSAASGTETITGTAAVTLADFTSQSSTWAWPTTISGRKILDQFGNVYLYKTMSSWGMYRLSNADITTALEGVAGNGFNGVTVWMGGGYRLNTTWQVSSSYYKNSAGANFWSGTPWASSLGSGWSTYDWIVSEANRLGITVTLSLPVAFDSTGARADMEAATNTQMYNAGVAISTRYLSSPNVVWHVMIDDNGGTGDTIGARIEAFFDGVNDTEGASTRPFRWTEVNNGNSTNEQGWLNTTQFAVPVNCMYEYGSNSVELFEAAYTESGATSGPAGDCEPPYDGSPHYSGNLGQQLRERSFAVFVEGGSVINYGHEDWWVFGADGLYTESGVGTWTAVQAHSHTVEQSHIWSLVDAYMRHTDWAPTSGFVTTGEGSGDTKAAQGAYARAAIAYFPSSRTVVVDTTILTGISKVRLRWYNPQDGTYTSIAASEAQQTGRSISYPSAHADTTNDWALVVDLDPTDGTAAVTLANFTSSATGTVGTVITGTSAQTLANFTGAASGTETISGTSAQTLANFTSAASGSQGVVGTSAQTLANFTSSATATETITGSSAQTLANFTSSAAGAESMVGTSAQTLANFTGAATGTETITGSGTPTLDAFTSSATGTVTITGGITAATATWSAVALSAAGSSEVTTALTPATATWSAVEIVATGANEAALMPALATWTAVPLTAAGSSNVSTALTPATATWSGVALASDAPATVALSPATATWTAVSLSAAATNTVSLALSPATATWSAQALTTSVSGSAAPVLTAATATWTAVPLVGVGVGTGPSTAMSPALATWSAVVLTVFSGQLAGGSVRITIESDEVRLSMTENVTQIIIGGA